MAPKEARHTLKHLLVGFAIVVLVSLYLIALVPYVFHNNLDRVGEVVEAQEYSKGALPAALQPYMSTFGDHVVALIVRQPLPLHTKIPVPERIIVIITVLGYSPGNVVEALYPTVDWNVDWRAYPFGVVFDRLIITDVVKELTSIEPNVEKVLLSQYGPLIYLVSFADFYAGPLLPLALVFLSKRTLKFWAISMTVTLYLFEQFLLAGLASAHNIYIDPTWRMIAYGFAVTGPLTVVLWHFERRPRGRHISETVLRI